MLDIQNTEKQIQLVKSFQELVSTNYKGIVNANCWERTLIGDFQEIIKHLETEEQIVNVEIEDLIELQLSQQGALAREILLNDFKLLSDYGASPNLNIIKSYDRDSDNPIFPTDVYSFHVDRSPIPTDTFLCTYFGDSSEIIPNSQAIQKILIPEIRLEIKERFQVSDENFESFVMENFYDLHYDLLPNVQPINLENGHLWRLAIDHPQLQVPPCIHRAPLEKNGQSRLLMIC